MQAHIAFMEQGLAGMKTILNTRTALYQVLTPKQKTVFDQFGPLIIAKAKSEMTGGVNAASRPSPYN